MSAEQVSNDFAELIGVCSINAPRGDIDLVGFVAEDSNAYHRAGEFVGDYGDHAETLD